MRKQILTLLLLILATPAFGFLGVTGKAEVDSNSKYVYRGFTRQDSFVIQPKASVSAFGLRAKLFNNVTLDPTRDLKKLDETHLTLRYDIGAMGFNITPGVKYYHNWNDGMDDTAEVSLGVSYTLLGIIGIYSTHYIDVMQDVGKYFGNVGAAFKFDFLPIIGIEGDMNLNWQKLKKDTSFMFPFSLNVGAAVKFKPMPFVYLKGHVDMTVLLNDEAKNLNSKETNIFYFGLALGVEL